MTDTAIDVEDVSQSKSLITEQGYHNLMLLYSLGVWLRHKLVIFGSQLTQLQNLIKSVTDINNINA